MKKNKRLLDSVGNIPDRFIEEAFFGGIIKNGKRKWITVLAAAACLIGAIAVPATVLNSRNKISDNKDNSVVTTAVSETKPEVTGYVNESGTVTGTGPARAEDYIPDRNYSRVKCKGLTGDNTVDFLKDKEFEKTVNDDIRQAINKIKESSFSEGISPRAEFSATIINGYMEITVMCEGYDHNHFETVEYIEDYEDHCIILAYDIINGKRIEKFSDLFYEGEEYSVIKPVEEIEFSKSGWDFSGEMPVLFGLDQYYLKMTDQNGSDFYIRKSAVDDSFDSHIIRKFRDPSDVLEEGEFEYAEEEWDEWELSYDIVQTDEDRKIETRWSSAFHSEQENSEMNSRNREMISTASDFLKSAVPRYDKLRNSRYNLYELYEEIPVPFICNLHSIRWNFASLYFSRDDLSIVSVNDIIPDWSDNIVSYDHIDSDEQSDEKPDPDDYDLIYISSADRDEENEGYYHFTITMINDDDECIAEAVIPADQINADYFDADKTLKKDENGLYKAECYRCVFGTLG